MTGAVMTQLKQLYEDDVVAWAEQQAQALRAAAHSNSNLPLDWENLAEEIEDLAKAYRSSLKSHLRRVIQHLVKLEHSPAFDPRHAWRRTILSARIEIRDLLEDSPSLRRQVSALIKSVTSGAIQLAIADLEEHGEMNPLMSRVIRRRAYTEEQILGDWFPPEPKEPPRRAEEA
jgi:hypothetical protein